jgi:hypothetical protein
VAVVCRVNLKHLHKFQTRVPHTKTREKVLIDEFPRKPSCRRTAKRRSDVSPLDFYLWGHSERRVFGCQWQRRDTSSTHFSCLWSHLQPPWNFRQGVTLHQQTCWCVQWLRCGHCRDTVRTEQVPNWEHLLSIVSGHLEVKYYIFNVFVTERNFPIDLKNVQFLQIYWYENYPSFWSDKLPLYAA